MNDGDGPVRLVGDQPPGELEAGVDYWAIRATATSRSAVTSATLATISLTTVGISRVSPRARWPWAGPSPATATAWRQTPR
jgi:hypothetical protein